ncbi:MAG: ADP-ribosylation/Crystallin [Micavibrio sp.]|nr:ADP-ribosylation/Crystallin [Micavibrio sp.]
MNRTSHSHPLRIDTIVVFGARLGLSICPGKVQAESHTGGWERDLEVDLDAVKQWGAGTIITLLEDHEMHALQVPLLNKKTLERGMDWIHLPFPNDTVPDDVWLAKFRLVQQELSQRIRNGENIFTHCMGGIGRTSLVVALLLIYQGWTAEQSITAIHRARADSFIMPEQEMFVRNYERALHNSFPIPQPK